MNMREKRQKSLKEIPEEYNCKSERFAYKKNGGIKREYGR